jgi:hypothetical protein
MLAAAMQGQVHGGRQPIAGASVQLWAVGSGSYGAAATKLGSSVATNASGIFSLGAYTCPTPGTLTYITASGGNPGSGSNNSNIMLAEALGACGNLNSGTFISMNEVTTAATAYALGQYFTPAVGGASTADSFGAPSTSQAQTGITNAFATVNNLVCGVSNNAVCGNSATGNAVISANFSGNTSVSGAITAWSITTNVATFTANNSLAVGQSVGLSGFGTSTFFNGTAVTVLPTGLSGTQFTANVTHANGSATEAGAFNGGSVTVTPEYAKLNTVADILASCVNSTGVADPIGTCATLFSSVVTTSGAAPTDTLQAAVYMSLNPTSNNANGSATNLAALYALVTAQAAPYVAVATQPTDWTIGIQYTDQTAGTYFLQPQNIAADSSGNIWVVNSPGNTTVLGSLLELSASGVPLLNALTSTVAGTGLSGSTPRNVAIDLNNNVWVTTSTSTGFIFEVSPSGATVGTASTGKSPYGIAVDANNNVFVGTGSSSAHFELYEFPGANLATPIVYPIATGTPGVAGTNGVPSYLLSEYMAFDTAGNLWMTNGSGNTETSVNQVVELSNINTTACNGYSGTYPCPAGGTGVSNIPLTTSLTQNTYTGFAPVTMASPFGIAANTNGMWVANSTGNNFTVSNISLTGASGNNYGGTSASLPASLRFVAVDGAGNVWVTNKGGAATAVAEISSAGTFLSPVSTGTAPFNVAGFVHPGLNASLGVTIDPSGNVWIANNTTAAGVFELVGAAAPTVTPIALALKNSAVGAKP